MRDPTIAIAWKVQNESLNGITECHRFGQLRGLESAMLSGIVPGAIDLQQLAEMTDGKGQLLLACLLDYRMSLVLAAACPTLFLTRRSPRPVARKNAPAQQCLPRRFSAPN